MSKKHLRYRVGIDVGLYSVGLSAIEIDDSTNNPYDAMPIKLLSCQSVIHDGGVDPSAQKVADSRKLVSGVARRTRRLHKRKRERLKKLDSKLNDMNLPVEKAKRLADEQKDPYLPWRARIALLNERIEDDDLRKLYLALAIRHIARHRGWRNPYSNVSSLDEASQRPSAFYIEYFNKLQKHLDENHLPFYPGTNKQSDDGSGKTKYSFLKNWEEIGTDRPTISQLIEALLQPKPEFAIRKNKIDSATATSAYIGKLHQSDNYFEVKKILEIQGIPDSDQDDLIGIIFEQINPKETGAASELVGSDQLDPTQKRASKASLEFQKYLILTTLHNLRIKTDEGLRSLTANEIKDGFNFLTSDVVNKKGASIDWHDLAEVLGVDRSMLSGIGGSTEDGDPISAKTPPSLETQKAITSIKGFNKDLAVLKRWWGNADDLSKEYFIESLGNAGISRNPLDEKTSAALMNVDGLYEELGKVSEKALEELDKLSLASGRAAYSIKTLKKLNLLMLEDGLNLHEARKKAFGLSDDWRPTGNPLGTETGNPATDRTIRIVSRWLIACERKWGKPETINLEHTREGFKSKKVAQDIQKRNNNRYKANQETRKAIVKDIYGDEYASIDPISKADIRRYLAIQRQNSQCAYCGKEINFRTAQMDHIVPRKGPGSSNVVSNLVAVCADCNESKSNTLFYIWASKEQRLETIKRVDTWLRDSFFLNEKDFSSYKKDVKSRLNQRKDDDPIDNRSIESVAWMARELAKQIESHFGYDGKTSFATEANDLFEVQRVNVFRGAITAEARKASGIENKLPWLSGTKRKDRLDRRHHAIDASVIAMMRPSVAKTLVERQSIREALGYYRKESKQAWKDYSGSSPQDKTIYNHWRKDQMQRLEMILTKSMNHGAIKVVYPLRLGLSLGKVHEDTIKRFARKKLADSWSNAAIDKVESPSLWLALRSEPDFDEKHGLPVNKSRQFTLNQKHYAADDMLGIMSTQQKTDSVESAVRMPVRGGYAEIGNTIHHARIYRIPKIKKDGSFNKYIYESVRVFQVDLQNHKKENLFEVKLEPQSYSLRNSTPGIRKALQNGTAEYLGWVVVNTIAKIDTKNPFFDPNKSQKINLLLRAFPDCDEFVITGFGTNSKLTLSPLWASSEQLPTAEEYYARCISKNTGDNSEKGVKVRFAKGSFKKEELASLFEAIKSGVPLAINVFMRTKPSFIFRNTLGYTRWRSTNHMPTSWKVE